jgi:hypothetical protein
MNFWIVALVVWMSAGGRIGRVLVRPASTVRMAIVVAVAGVALASTATIPDVARAIDSADRLRVTDPKLSDVQAIAAWVVFTAATSVVAIAAWPIASRRNLWNLARGIYLAAAVVAALTLTVSPLVGWVGIALGGMFITVTGLRNLAWNPLGRGITIYTAGALVIMVLAVAQIYRAVTLGVTAARHPRPTWAWSGASLFIATGAVWILVEVWIRSRILMRRIRPLHQVLVTRFPEVLVDDPKARSTTVLRSSDQVAQIMDALYLQSGGGAPIAPTQSPPDSDAARAAIVARWARDPSLGILDPRWIAPPEGMSARRWVSTVARAYTVDLRTRELSSAAA